MRFHVLRLVLALLHLSGFKLDHDRVPDAEGKQRILGAIERARQSMPLTAALRVLGLSAGRYYDWVGREEGCSLDDQRSCPRSKPQRLTYQEVEVIGDMVQSREYRHMPIRGLALHAQRIGKVFAHPGTWAKLIRERGWLRPRLRLHPAKPRLGFRAAAPNEPWHVDVTIIKLLDGTRAYLHAVIDAYSRRILAWTVAEKLNPMNTCYVLNEAAAYLSEPETKVFMDSGGEPQQGRGPVARRWHIRARHRAERRELLEFLDRELVVFPKTRMVVYEPSPQHGYAAKAVRVLRS